MAEFFEMPQASPTMEAGTLLSWKKSEGDALEPQDVIAEVETDKAAMDIEVFDKGVLLKILAAEGDEIPAGQPIAIIGTDKGEDIAALLEEFEKRKAAAPAPAESSEEAPTETNAQAPVKESAPSAPAKAAPAPVQAGFQAGTWQGNDLPLGIMELPESFGVEAKVRASPLARKIAASKGVDLGGVQGSGPHGRITKADVENARGGSAPASGPGFATRQDEVIKNSKMRKTIAKRLKQSWSDAPVFYLNAVFDCDRMVDFRSQFKEQELKVSYNDIVIKAVARALADVPECNATWSDEAITRYGDVHIGMAVALPDGLITPVIRHADKKSLLQIATETRELAGRARERKLQPEEYTGGTFSVSNLGMMDIEHFTAIINPPEAGILAIGSMKEEPVWIDGDVEAQYRMRVTMTCDHRVIDGALGARFLQAVRQYVENPALLA